MSNERSPDDQTADRRATDRRKGRAALKKNATRRSAYIIGGYLLLGAGSVYGLAKSNDVAQSNKVLALQAKYETFFQEYAQCRRGNDFRDVVVISISGSLDAALQASIPPGTEPRLAQAGIRRVERSVDRQLTAVTDTKRVCKEPKPPKGVQRRFLTASDFGSKGMPKP